MKNFLITLLLSTTLLSKGNCQPYDTIRLGYHTSVNLIFESKVNRWDMGLGVRLEDGEEVWDVLVENPPESSNRIKLAAGIRDFQTTNLFVETEAAYYNFILQYDENPKKLLFQFDQNEAEITKKSPDPVIERMEKPGDITPGGDEDLSTDSLYHLCLQVEKEENGFNPIGKMSQEILFYLGGIYVFDQYMFFKVYVRNESTIRFDIGFLGFFKKDDGKSRNQNRPILEEQLNPLFILNHDAMSVESNQEILKVYAFPKFTLSKRKKLYIQLWEGNMGERKTELVVKSRDLLNASRMILN